MTPHPPTHTRKCNLLSQHVVLIRLCLLLFHFLAREGEEDSGEQQKWQEMTTESTKDDLKKTAGKDNREQQQTPS